MKVTLPVTYSQTDAQWGTLLLGYNTDSKFNIANYGCLVACLAMVARYFGKDVNLAKMNDLLKQVTGFSNGGVYVWGGINKAFGDISEKVTSTPQALTDDQLGEIKAALDKALPVIVQIDYNPATVPVDSHFVVLVDYDPNDENNFTIVDPLGGQIKSLKQGYLSWLKPSVRKTIEEYFIYEGPLQPVTPPTPPAPTPAPGDIEVPIETNERLVKKSTQWDKTVEYLELEKSADDAMFEHARRVIAGFKSRITDFQRQAEAAQKAQVTAEANTTVLETQNSTLKADLTREQKAHKDEVDALKQSAQNPENLKKTYDANLAAVQKERDDALEEVRKLRIEIAQKQTAEALANGNDTVTVGNGNPQIKTSSNFLTKLLQFFLKVES